MGEFVGVAQEHFTAWIKLLDYGHFGLRFPGLERLAEERVSPGRGAPLIFCRGQWLGLVWRAVIEEGRRGALTPRSSKA